MRKRAAVVALIFLFVWFGSSCAPNDGKLELTKGHDVDFSPLAPLEWGMTQEEALAALNFSEEQVEHMEQPYDWMIRGEIPDDRGTPSGDVLRIKEPVQVLGIEAKEVCLQMMDLKGLNEGKSTEYLLSDVFAWFPYENEESLEAVKKAVAGLYGEDSPVKIKVYDGRETPVNSETTTLWYGTKTLYDTLTQESSDYFLSIQLRAAFGTGREETWEEGIKATKLSYAETFYSPDHYFNVGEGGYEKQEPPLIEVRFNGEVACIALYLNEHTAAQP